MTELATTEKSLNPWVKAIIENALAERGEAGQMFNYNQIASLHIAGADDDENGIIMGDIYVKKTEYNQEDKTTKNEIIKLPKGITGYFLYDSKEAIGEWNVATNSTPLKTTEFQTFSPDKIHVLKEVIDKNNKKKGYAIIHTVTGFSEYANLRKTEPSLLSNTNQGIKPKLKNSTRVYFLLPVNGEWIPVVYKTGSLRFAKGAKATNWGDQALQGSFNYFTAEAKEMKNVIEIELRSDKYVYNGKQSYILGMYQTEKIAGNEAEFIIDSIELVKKFIEEKNQHTLSKAIVDYDYDVPDAYEVKPEETVSLQEFEDASILPTAASKSDKKQVIVNENNDEDESLDSLDSLIDELL